MVWASALVDSGMICEEGDVFEGSVCLGFAGGEGVTGFRILLISILRLSGVIDRIWQRYRGSEMMRELDSYIQALVKLDSVRSG